MDSKFINYTNLITPYGTQKIDDFYMDEVRTTEAVMNLYHPDEYKTTRKAYAKQHPWKKQKVRQSKGRANLSIDMWKLCPDLTPNFDKIHQQKFKKLLCQANPSYRRRLQPYLSNQKLLSCVQKSASLACTKVQLEMEKDYWIHVIDRLLFAVRWLSQMPKNFTQKCSINWDYPRTEQNIRHRQKLIENKLKQIHHDLEIHLKTYHTCQLISKKISIDQTMHIISDALKVMLENHLQNLHQRFEQKKSLIQNDAYDIQLLKLFNDLCPTEDQKRKAEKIWRGKRKYCERRIREIKTSLLKNKQANIAMIINENTQHEDMNRDHQPYQIPFLESFDHTMRTIIQTRRTNMANRTQKIISFLNATESTCNHK